MLYNIDTIYVLNLPHRTDRLQHQLKQFKDFDITNYEIVHPIMPSACDNFLNKAIYSCYLSHVHMLEKIKQHKKLCLILEDDALIDDIMKINLFLQEFFDDNNNWDMLYFYYYQTHAVTNKSYLKIDKVLNTHAYIVNPQSVESILDILYEYKNKIHSKQLDNIANCHIDRALALSVHSQKNIFASTERLIKQNKALHSDIPWFIAEKTEEDLDK